MATYRPFDVTLRVTAEASLGANLTALGVNGLVPTGIASAKTHFSDDVTAIYRDLPPISYDSDGDVDGNETADILRIRALSTTAQDSIRAALIDGALPAGLSLRAPIGSITPAGGYRYEPYEEFPLRIDVKEDYGAAGDGTTSDANAIDNALSAALSKTSYFFNDSNHQIDASWAMNGPAVYFPSGDYVYDGSGYSADVDNEARVLTLYGDGMMQTRLVLDPGVVFLTFPKLIYIRVVGMQIYGGSGFLNVTDTSQTGVQRYYIHDFAHQNFTGCSIGNNATDMAWWSITHSRFKNEDDAAYAGSIAVALSGLNDHAEVNSVSFDLHRGTSLKLGRGGNNCFVVNCWFPGAARDIWIEPHTSTVNAGQGCKVFGNKFGNEHVGAGDYRIIVADEGSGTNFLDKQPATTESTGYWYGALLTHNLFAGASGIDQALIYSTTKNIGRMVWEHNPLYPTYAPYFVQFHGDISALPANLGNYMNLTGIDPTASLTVSNLSGFATTNDPFSVIA